MDCYTLLNKNIISIYECENVGVVNNLLFNKIKKNLEYLEIKKENGITYYLSTKNIFTVHPDSILIKNNSLITTNIPDGNFNLIKNKCYSFDGKYLGKIENILIENYKIVNVILDNKMDISNNNILNFSNKILLVNLSDIKVKLCNYKVKNNNNFIINNNNINTKILTNDKMILSKISNKDAIPIDILSNISKNNNIINNHQYPIKILANPNILLNRIIIKNVLNKSNEVLFHKGEIITNAIINQAKKSGQIFDLIQNSIIKNN